MPLAAWKCTQAPSPRAAHLASTTQSCWKLFRQHSASPHYSHMDTCAPGHPSTSHQTQLQSPVKVSLCQEHGTLSLAALEPHAQQLLDVILATVASCKSPYLLLPLLAPSRITVCVCTCCPSCLLPFQRASPPLLRLLLLLLCARMQQLGFYVPLIVRVAEHRHHLHLRSGIPLLPTPPPANAAPEEAVCYAPLPRYISALLGGCPSSCCPLGPSSQSLLLLPCSS
mmetsp:Transcript_8679/g.21710  ORF Transcript_8679/g.21710 Transcript_8679/m.21710 type:complete len:226 (+) Transcript_8679:709-1386(+)